ncbi:GbsR/MarR family transcriptional regulator [Motiliproteus sediminis]|uniref:GbsR/MarR family transcriptional regulator n=1 Tax=Motiliproteus sediminis TaxID=1468178 RepID=UPI001AF02849|nr:hypothetical protein [Motiliproteus sediminis]
MQLTPAMRRFIDQWSDLGARWGGERQLSQVHALLYLAPEALSVAQIAAALALEHDKVARHIDTLSGWRLITPSRSPDGSDKQYSAHADIWELVFVMMEEHQQKSLQPALDALAACVQEAEHDGQTPIATRLRMSATRDFLADTAGWIRQLRRLDGPALRTMLRFGGKLQRLWR